MLGDLTHLPTISLHDCNEIDTGHPLPPFHFVVTSTGADLLRLPTFSLQVSNEIDMNFAPLLPFWHHFVDAVIAVKPVSSNLER